MFAISCDPTPSHEEELITNLEYSLTDSTGKIIKLIFSDPDGEGGNAPIISVSDDLIRGEKYSGKIQLRNESSGTPEDITEEIKGEDEDHQFFYEGTNSISVAYKDKDSNNNPIGLVTELVANSSGASVLKITLRHLPNKSASGVTEGKITNAGGETDIEVSFNINVR